MSIIIGGASTTVQSNAGTGAELLTAGLAKNQQEREGQMVLQMIQSASVDNIAPPTENLGNHVNIKV
jgi:hypothetical protein